MVVSSRVPEMAMTVPPTHAPTPSTAVGAGNDSSTKNPANSTVTAYDSTMGLRGLRRWATRPPVANPRPKHEMTTAHDAAPSRNCSAMSGPPTKMAGITSSA